MAQASGSLSSAVHAVEGVPLPSSIHEAFVVHFSSGLFTACLQLPPPPDSPDYPPTAIEQFFVLFVTLSLIFALVLLVLPEKWSRKIIKIAFCIGPKDR